ncbi:unnamed protein product [Colias eurytheme]|nr:unnamed protein product [Colias eurytheme]
MFAGQCCIEVWRESYVKRDVGAYTSAAATVRARRGAEEAVRGPTSRADVRRAARSWPALVPVINAPRPRLRVRHAARLNYRRNPTAA